ncbi:hypothetical protein LCGC14_1883920 [marine sediment metagenome]|uniref:Uncharacterized protein n=1 Tax=marine sediment metagenome TaxID=412755 RepID=A0A0F9G1I9_9ZZZZ
MTKKKVKQEEIPIKKRRKHLRYIIVHNVGGLTDARGAFEFYHQRQTIENFFKESKNLPESSLSSSLFLLHDLLTN